MLHHPELGELSKSERSSEIGHVALVAQLDDVVPPGSAARFPLPRIACQAPHTQHANSVRDPLVVRRGHPSFASGQILRGVEAETCHI